jgi:WD40 repeat protein
LLLASASVDGTARLWDIAPGDSLDHVLVEAGGTVMRDVAFGPDGSLLGASTDVGSIWVGRPTVELPLVDEIHADFVVFGSDGSLLASQDSGQTYRLVSLGTRQPVGEPLSLDGPPVAISNDGKLLASVSRDGELRVHDPVTGDLLISIREDDAEQVIWSLAFDANGSLLASGSFDGRIQLWNTASGAPVGEPLLADGFSVEDLAFSPDGSRLASANNDGTVRLWDVSTGKPVGDPLIGHSHAVQSVAFSPDGALVASGGSDGSIRLWDPQTGAQVGVPMTGHDGAVSEVVFDPRGESLASAGLDGTVRLWPAVWEVGGACDLVAAHVTAAQLTPFLPEGREPRSCFRE